MRLPQSIKRLREMTQRTLARTGNGNFADVLHVKLTDDGWLEVATKLRSRVWYGVTVVKFPVTDWVAAQRNVSSICEDMWAKEIEQ